MPKGCLGAGGHPNARAKKVGSGHIWKTPGEVWPYTVLNSEPNQTTKHNTCKENCKKEALDETEIKPWWRHTLRNEGCGRDLDPVISRRGWAVAEQRPGE
jgi:hypothetical protein